MKQIRSIATAALCAVAMISGVALASSHREAPAIAVDPAADNTDLYAWVEPARTTSLHRRQLHPARGAGRRPELPPVRRRRALRDPHRARRQEPGRRGRRTTSSSTPRRRRRSTRRRHRHSDGKEFIGIQFFAQIAAAAAADVHGDQGRRRQRRPCSPRTSPVAPPNIGPRTDAVVYQPTVGQTYDDAFAATFIRDLKGGRGHACSPARATTASTSTSAASSTSPTSPRGREQRRPTASPATTCHSIALEIPTTQLTGNGKAPSNRRRATRRRSASGRPRAGAQVTILRQAASTPTSARGCRSRASACRSSTKR